MKNITVSVDDDLYRRARVRAAEQGTSISKVVKNVLVEFATGETERERVVRERELLYAEVDARLAGLTGDAVYPGWRDDLYATARGGSDETAQAA